MSTQCIDLPVIEVIEVVDSITNITEINPQPVNTITLDVDGGLSIDIFTPAPALIEVLAPVQVLEVIGASNSFENVLELNTTPIPIPGPPGLSAYELALDNGFVGTLEQWFVSIIAQNINEVLVQPATNSYIMNHNLGYNPNVQVFDLFGNEVTCCVQHTSDNQFIIGLSTPKEFKIIYR